MCSDRDKDVQIEAVVRFPEEKEEQETEDAGSCQTPVQPGQLCKVKGEEKQHKSSEEVAEEGDHSTGDALRYRVNRLNEQLQEDGHTTVDEDTHQDAGGVESGFSGGQVSEPGQAGESEPGGRQGCTGKHQHENQLQHPSNIVSKPRHGHTKHTASNYGPEPDPASVHLADLNRC